MKKAFTLAEQLITLSIIGIIAVLMYSNLMRVKPDENALLYKKAFYSIQDVIKSLANDVAKYPNSSTVLTEPDSKVANGLTYQKYLCTQVAGSMNTAGTINCDGTTVSAGSDGVFGDSSYEFKLPSGMTFTGFNQTFEDEDSNSLTSDSITVCVDVNGLNRGPNTGCSSSDDQNAKNRDQYKIRIHQDGKVSTGDGTNWEKENEILEDIGVNTKK